MKYYTLTINGKSYPVSADPAMPLLRVLGRFDPSLAAVVVDLDKVRQGDSTKAKQLLDWQPIDSREAVLSCAESMFRVGLISE
ncbi:hypothetical protein [Spirosoma koreense]